MFKTTTMPRSDQKVLGLILLCREISIALQPSPRLLLKQKLSSEYTKVIQSAVLSVILVEILLQSGEGDAISFRYCDVHAAE
jgi:hypothetical protein